MISQFFYVILWQAKKGISSLRIIRTLFHTKERNRMLGDKYRGGEKAFRFSGLLLLENSGKWR